MFKTILTSLCLMPTLSYAWIALGNVMGRDLDVPGMGWIGHVGIVYAESYIPPDKVSTQGRVIEVLNENQVIQINTFQSFKSKSNYWGNGSGVANNSTDNIMKILKEANTQRGFCPIYTTTALYQPGTPNSCAVFRCDTFVYHIYYSVGYKLIKDGGVMLPESIFKAFPFHYSEYSINTNKLNSVTSMQLANMDSIHFSSIINAPIDGITIDEINNTLNFALDPNLSIEKRTLLMDKLGFIGQANMLPQLVEHYSKIQDDKLRSMLLRSTLMIYQRYLALKDYPKEKEILQKFYMQLLDAKLSNNDANIVVRGFTQLSKNDVVFMNIDKINTLLNRQDINLDSEVILGLKIELAFKSNELERIYIPDILNMLTIENNQQLENILNQFIVRRLSGSGFNSLEFQSKKSIRTYLNSVQKKYVHPDEIKKDTVIFTPFYGAWLEALALVTANSPEEVSQFITHFINNKTLSEQIIFKDGLSNKY